MEEDLLYFLLFVFIVSINIFAKNKNLLKKLSGKTNSGKSIPNVHKKIRNIQKTNRRKNFSYIDKKYTTQVQPRIIEENSKKSLNQSLRELNKIYSSGSQLQQKKFEQIHPVKKNDFQENSVKQEFNFNPETMRDAIIWKEILDLPLALR